MPTSYENEINARKTWELLQPELKYGGAVDPLPGMMQEVAPLKAAKSLPFIVKVAQLLDSLKRNEPDFEQDYDTAVVPKKIKSNRKPLKDLARENISLKAEDLLNKKITNRNTVYHLTDGHGFDGILNSGYIRPGYGTPQKIPGLSEINTPDQGVSTMRYITGPKSKGKAIVLEIDKNKVPKLEAVSDTGYEKYDEYWGNRSFWEAESKTHNKKIPLDAIKQVIINRNLVNNKDLHSMDISDEALERLKRLNIPVKVSENKPNRVNFERAYNISIGDFREHLKPSSDDFSNEDPIDFEKIKKISDQVTNFLNKFNK